MKIIISYYLCITSKKSNVPDKKCATVVAFAHAHFLSARSERSRRSY